MKELDYLGIFSALNKKKIKYAVCGGVAVNLLGVPRMTYDIDLLLKMDDANLKKCLLLLRKFGFKPKVPVNIIDFAEREKREKWIKEKRMKAFNLYHPRWAISEIDILIDVPVDYAEARKRVVFKRAGKVKIPVVSAEHLIRMKKNTGRRQDKADAEYLKKIA